MKDVYIIEHMADILIEGGLHNRAYGRYIN